jgi:DNA-binding MarR family transcriptional regulator
MITDQSRAAKPVHAIPPADEVYRVREKSNTADAALNYLAVLTLAERLHRQFLEVITVELEAFGLRDINNVRALIVLNIGEAEMTASELMWRNCYLGSNVSYNLKKLTESGYVVHERSTHDRRVVIVRNSQTGLDLCDRLRAMNRRHLDSMLRADLKLEDVDTCGRTLRALQSFWSRTIQPGAMSLGRSTADTSRES